MTDGVARLCAVCANDKFFLLSREGSDKCDLACAGCGVRTSVMVGSDGRDTLVEAP